MAASTITIGRAHLDTRATESPEKLSSSDSKKINYLNRCIVELSASTENYHRISGILRQTAIIIGTIAFAALCFATPFFAFTLPPVAAGLCVAAVILSSFGFSFYAFVFREHLEMTAGNFVEPSFEKATTIKEMRKIYNALPTSAAEVLAKLREIGIKPEDLDPSIRENPAKLRPVLAHYLYWRNLCTKDSPFNIPLETSDQTKMICQEKALRAKAQAAFYLGILKSPYSDKKFSDVVKFASSSEERYKIRFSPLPKEFSKAYELKDGDVECMKINSESVSYKEIFTLSIEDLSKKIFRSDRI